MDVFIFRLYKFANFDSNPGIILYYVVFQFRKAITFSKATRCFFEEVIGFGGGYENQKVHQFEGALRPFFKMHPC
jgi:hypothetical protein